MERLPDDRGRRGRARHRRAVGGVGVGTAAATCEPVLFVDRARRAAGHARRPRAAQPHRAVDVARGARAAAGAARAGAPPRGARRADVGARAAGRARAARAARSCSQREPHQPRRGRGDLRGRSRCRWWCSPAGAGEISLGQMAFVAIGAAVGGSITARARAGTSALGLLGAGLVGAAVATLIGLPVLRRRGLTLAVDHACRSRSRRPRGCSTRSFFGEGDPLRLAARRARIERPDLFGFIDVRVGDRASTSSASSALALVVIAVVGIRRSADRARADRDPRERTGRRARTA